MCKTTLFAQCLLDVCLRNKTFRRFRFWEKTTQERRIMCTESTNSSCTTWNKIKANRMLTLKCFILDTFSKTQSACKLLALSCSLQVQTMLISDEQPSVHRSWDMWIFDLNWESTEQHKMTDKDRVQPTNQNFASYFLIPWLLHSCNGNYSKTDKQRCIAVTPSLLCLSQKVKQTLTIYSC